MGRLSGKVCLITGTGGSMGSAAALAFSREGAMVVGCDINPESGQETLEAVRAEGGQMVSMHPCDLTDAEQCRALVNLSVEKFGRLDVLFNNAAMAYFAPFSQMPDDVWYKTIDHELHIVFTMTRTAWPVLSKQGGTVISTASGAAWMGSPALGGVAHSAAKGAIVALTRQLAVEGGPLGIRANTISPGLIVTKQTMPLLADPAWEAEMMIKPLIKRAGTPAEVANLALFLASDEAPYITGADIRIDGGASAC